MAIEKKSIGIQHICTKVNAFPLSELILYQENLDIFGLMINFQELIHSSHSFNVHVSFAYHYVKVVLYQDMIHYIKPTLPS